MTLPVPAAMEQIGSSDSERLTGLADFVEGAIAQAFEAHRLVGGAVVVVAGDHMVLKRGYGVQDAETRTAVDPDTTLFRIASVSKLITATAVMQLVEAGRLDLDSDVNTYLRELSIPESWQRPITLRHLLTHSSGVEDRWLGFLIERRAEDCLPLDEAVARYMPARVRPPVADFSDAAGVAYSNWAFALAGHLVAEVSGHNYHDYVARKVLDPLGMTRTTSRETVAVRSADHLARGHALDAGAAQVAQFEYLCNFAPSGAFSSTAADMARFIHAYLQEGNGLVGAETARLMLSRQLATHPRLDGMGLGFIEQTVNGWRTVGHDGATPNYGSELVLIPEAEVGYFIVFNSREGQSALSEFKRAFMDRYFPAVPDDPAQDPVVAAAASGDHAGAYRWLRRSHTRFEKLLFFGGDIKVRSLPDGTLTTENFLAPDLRWRPVGPDVYEEIDGARRIAFRRNASGAVTHLHGPVAVLTADRLHWYESSGFHRLILGACILVFLSVLPGALSGRRSVSRADIAGSAVARSWRGSVIALSVVNLVFIGLVFLGVRAGPVALNYEMPASLMIGLLLPVPSALLTLAAAVLMALTWRKRRGRALWRLHYSTVVIAACALLWWVDFWNVVYLRAV